MERWSGRVAVVTGASAGIGAAIAKILVESGMKVVGCARRVEVIQEFAKEWENFPGKLYAYKCDMESDEDIVDMFKWIADNKDLGKVDVCINNAGMSTPETLLEGKYENWKKMMNINVVALCLCTKLSIESMQANNINDGHIVMIGSMSGHRVPPSPSTRFYAATKHAVTALIEGWRQSVREINSQIRISGLSPGLVETEFAEAMTGDKDKAKMTYDSIKCLQAVDMAESVKYILSAPPHVQIHDILVRPTDQKS
jgi:NADP-dependent 3-hydroxy acid dehydrogenase YdfG